MNGGSAASNSKKDVPAGGLTQKDLKAGRAEKTAGEEEDMFTSLLQAPATLS
jgi:hypothetical protein